MPTYIYKCPSCFKTFEKRHSMAHQEKSCIFCNKEGIFKVPSLKYTNNKIDKAGSPRTGKVVDDYIKLAKEEVRKEKRRLQSEEV